MKLSVGKKIGAVAWWAVAIAAASDTMPVAQQNAMVKQYCAVCHKDSFKNGGLSLEHFDAADSDPGLAAMLVSKLKNGALGASGQKLPDKATQEAFQSALTAASAGANEWVVKHGDNQVSASVVREAASSAVNGVSELYRVTVVCNGATHEGELQVAWSPRVPPAGEEMSAAADGKALGKYRLEGGEKMGNGQPGTSGTAAAILRTMGLPTETLTVRDVFPNQTIEFPFGALNPKARQALSACFAGN